MMQSRQGSITGSRGAVACWREIDGESLARSWMHASTPEEFSPNRPVNFPIGEELGSQNDVSAMVDLIDHSVFDTQCMHAIQNLLGFDCRLLVSVRKPARRVNQGKS